MANTSTPTWALPDTDTSQLKRRNVPISMTEHEIERADALATATGQTRSQLLKRLVHDELYSSESEQILRMVR